MHVWTGGVIFVTCMCAMGVMGHVFAATPPEQYSRVTVHWHGNGEDMVISHSTGALMKSVNDIGYFDSIMMSQNIKDWTGGVTWG